MTLESEKQSGARPPVVAVVLAAGMGTRLAPLTQEQPKCLVPVRGRPILEHALETLPRHGVRDVIVTVGYLGDRIRRRVDGRFPGVNVRFVRNDAYASTGSLMSFLLALDACPPGCDVLLIEGDVVFEDALLAWLFERARGEAAATVLEPYAPHLTGTLALLDADAYVSDVVHEKVRPADFPFARSYKTTNITLFSAAARAPLEAAIRATLARHGDAAPLEHALHDFVAGGTRLRGVITGGRKWYEIDTPEDLAAAERMFQELFPCAASSAS